MPDFLRRCLFAWDPIWAPNLWAINPYIGCPFDCEYCWSKAMAKRFHREPPGGWRNVQPRMLPNLYHNALLLAPPSTILVGATCDPYPPLEKTEIRTGGALYDLHTANIERVRSGRHPHKILVLTKSPIVCRDWEMLKEMGAWVGLSITAPASVDTREWEPHAPSTEKRIKALRYLHSQGIKTFLSCEPWLVKLPLNGQNWEHDITRPVDLILRLANYVDYFILGSWNRGGRPLPALVDFYRAELPFAREALEATGRPFWIKPELAALDQSLPNGYTVR